MVAAAGLTVVAAQPAAVMRAGAFPLVVALSLVAGPGCGGGRLCITVDSDAEAIPSQSQPPGIRCCQDGHPGSLDVCGSCSR